MSVLTATLVYDDISVAVTEEAEDVLSVELTIATNEIDLSEDLH